MSGLQNIPIRWPERYDPAFFDRIFREVLANADVRNANAGAGITITGTPNEVATISASQDIEDLIDAGILTATDSGTDDARQLVAGNGTIVITDNGGGSTIEIEVGEIQITNLGPVADLSVLGVPTADDGFDAITTINSSDNDTLLRRVSDTLDWGVLTAGMFPDSMVTVLSGTELEIETGLVDLHSDLDVLGDVEIQGGNALTILDAAGTDSLAFSHDGTDALAVITNGTAFALSGAAELELRGGMDLWLRDAGFLRIYDSTDTDYGQFSHDGIDLNLTFVNTTAFNIALATEITGTLTVSSSISATSHIRTSSAGGGVLGWTDDADTYFSNPTASNVIAVVAGGSTTGLLGQFDWTIQTVLTVSSLAPRIVVNDTGGAGVDETNWLIGGTNGILTIATATDAAPSTIVENAIRLFRSGTAVTEIQIDAPLLDFNGDMDLGGRLYVTDADGLRVYDSGATDYAQFSHDGTDFNTTFNATAEWNIGVSISITGSVTATGDGTFNTSDRRLKRDLVLIDNALERIRHIRGFTYEKMVGGAWEDFRRAGVIAQDVEQALPEAVMVKDGYRFVSDASLSGLFASAINDLAERLEQLEHRLAA